MAMKSGDWCEVCPIGMMRVYCTRKVASSAIRYLKCDVCGATGIQTLPADLIPRRRTKQGKPHQHTSQNIA